MKKVLKTTLGVAAAVAITGAAVAPVVFAWGDNLGGRQTYSLDQINKEKATKDKVVFNSIVDNGAGYVDAGNIMPLTDERNFVGARDASTGNQGKNNVWNGNDIAVEEDKTYIVRLYAHNNGIDDKDGQGAAKATGVSVAFDLPKVVDTEERVTGYINVGNPTAGTPSKYWDSVVFKSGDGRKFYLDYVEGSALLENNGFAANGGKTMSDNVVNGGTAIGYNGFDGVVPGCYNYAEYITIAVKPVFEDSAIEKQVRLEGTKEWKESVDAKIGDKVEYKIHYKNLNASTVNATIQDSLPAGLKMVSGTTKLYNDEFKNGATTNDDTLVTTGVNIGDYAVKGDGYITFTAEVVDEQLVCGTNRLINWAKASQANGFAVQDSADVYVVKDKSYKECQDEPTPTPTPTPTTTTTVTKTTTTPSALPSTGPETIVTGVLGAGSLTTAAGYYLASRKKLR